MSGTQLQLGFDYDALDSETRIVVQQRTGEIRGLMRRAAQDIVDIGLKLIEVKEALPHGRFLPWLQSEFKEWGRTSAFRFMTVAEKFKDSNLEHLAPSALYLLAEKDTPETARQEALAIAAKGEAVSHAKAREILDAHKQPQPRDEPVDAFPGFTARVADRVADEAVAAGSADEAKAYREIADSIRPPAKPAPPEAVSGTLFPLPVAPPPGGKLKGFVTLEQWQGMDAKERSGLLVPPAGSESRFNAQGDNENIEWALWSWNPVTGCLHDCPYCYARDIANRFYEQKFEPSLWPDRLAAPASTPFPEAKAKEWMGHKNVFTCSMADLFGRWVPREWIEAVLDAVRAAPKWNFLFLTKFPIRMAEFDFPANAWVGTSVDCQARVKNAEKAFRKVKAGVKWLSCEPLIEPLRFDDLGAFDWLVIGGASASSRTPEWHPPRGWVEALEKQAREAGVKVYEKSNLLERIREYPGVESDEPARAPEALRYLPSPEA